MPIASCVKSFVLLAFLALFAVQPVLAQEEPPVIKALYDTFAELGGERPTHDKLEVNDGTITITGLKLLMLNFQQDGEDVRQELTAREMVFKDVKTLSDGLFEVGTLTIRKMNVSVSSPTIVVASVSVPVTEMTGAIFRSPDHMETALDRWVAQQLLARHTTIPLMTIEAGGFSFDAHDLKYDWTGDAKTGLGEWVYAIGSIEFPASMLPATPGTPSLGDLGYSSIVLGATGRSAIALEQDLISVEFDSTFSLRDLGAFTMEAALSGIQPSLIDAVQAIRESPNAIDMNAMMAMLQVIKLKLLTLRYDDASLMERIFTYLQDKRGMTREDVIAQALGSVDAGSVFLNTPELIRQTKDALRVFLNNPGWIQFEMRPEPPVSAAQVMPLIAVPAEIVKLLKVQITAGAKAE